MNLRFLAHRLLASEGVPRASRKKIHEMVEEFIEYLGLSASLSSAPNEACERARAEIGMGRCRGNLSENCAEIMAQLGLASER